MAERKRAMRGGMDPKEMAKRSLESRRLRKEAAEKKASEDFKRQLDAAVEGGKGASGTDLAGLPREKLIQVLQDPTVHPRELVQAAKALAALPVDDESSGWRASTQVREDFVPPDWGQVLLVARAAGAFDN